MNIAWRSELSTGIESIDDQHKELISLSNRLLVSIRDGKSGQELRAIFHKLSEYTVYHFAEEEEFMERIGYHKVIEHRERHIRLKQEVREFQHRLFCQEEITAQEVLEFLKVWLLEHILQYDRDIAKYCAHLPPDE